ncbi:MAG: hypothetical protein COB77_00935 [Gammaproteobacteria bacterium]|nr:MAG: hypothetical protein COB77_00935 [Gammaproteobacteria bacterium]
MDKNNTHDKEKLDRQIRLEEIHLLYGGTPFSYTASVVIAFIIYGVLLDHADSPQYLNIWLLTILGVMVVRSVESYRFSKLNKEDKLKSSWRIRFFIGTAIAGTCWGLLPWLGYSSEVEYIAFIIVCQVGVIAGSLSTLSYRWETMVLFLVPSSFLLILRLLLDDQHFSDATTYVLCVFVFFSLSAGKRIFDNTQQNIRLRIEADNRERAIELLHQKQALHLQNTPLAIIEFDIDLNICEWNNAAETIFGYPHDEAIGENIMRLILLRNNSTNTDKLWQRLLNHEALIGETIENKTKSGKPIFCQWFITPLTDKHNAIVGIAAMALDITDKKHNEAVILKAKEEAEKANQAKSDFLSNMSHELRTPLNAILGFTQLLKYEKELSEKQHSHINEIDNAGNLLLELVNQILDLAKIEKGHLQLSIEKIAITDTLQACHAMVAPLAKQQNITLNFETTSTSYVLADHTRLKQVLLNLLSNAIKYNKYNGSVNVRAITKENGTVRIYVADTGKGISKELLPDIFQAFNRLDAANNIQGTGIGLSISKQLVTMMGGKIGVTSQKDEGSEFWIELPGHAELNTIIKSESHPITAKPIQNKTIASNYHILVAEDNPTNQTLILNQLEKLGYQADLVTNGQEALNMMANKNYHLLLTDCNMPLMDGYTLAKTIRESGNHKIPIIALTADAYPESKEKCLSAGMNEQIIKPFQLETLQETLESHLN